MRNLILAITMVALPSAPIFAQSLQPGGQYSNDDRRVSVGLTIPFGNGGSRAEREPRLELVFDHRQRDANGSEISDISNADRRSPVRLGLTLSKTPQAMLNGREIPSMAGRRHISTVGWVAIGALVVGGGALLFYDALDDASE